MTTHSSILAWRIPWREEPGGPQSKWSQRVGHNWGNLAHVYASPLSQKYIKRSGLNIEPCNTSRGTRPQTYCSCPFEVHREECVSKLCQFSFLDGCEYYSIYSLPFHWFAQKGNIYIYIYLQPYFHLNKGNLVLLTKIYVLLENILCPSLYSSLWASAYCLKCFIILSICHSYLSSMVNSQKTQGLYSADEAIYRF